MRWPGIRDGNRRQGFFKGKGTGHDATSRHTGSRRGATQRGRSRNWRMTQGINRNLVQRTGQTTTIRIQEGRRDHTRLDDTPVQHRASQRNPHGGGFNPPPV